MNIVIRKIKKFMENNTRKHKRKTLINNRIRKQKQHQNKDKSNINKEILKSKPITHLLQKEQVFPVSYELLNRYIDYPEYINHDYSMNVYFSGIYYDLPATSKYVLNFDKS